MRIKNKKEKIMDEKIIVLISALSGGFLGIIGSIIVTIINNRSQNQTRTFTTLLEEYKSYYNKIEEVSNSSINDYIALSEKMEALFKNILTNPSNNAFLENLQHLLNEFTNNQFRKIQVLQTGILTIKLVCSDKVLAMIEELIQVNLDIINNLQELVKKYGSRLQVSDEMHNDLIAKTTSQDRAKELANRILLEMRKDIRKFIK